MKVLTYNISWESMTGRRTDWPFCNNNNDPSNSRHYMHCVENIATMIDNNGPYDFIGLQESANYKLLIKQSATLQTMKFKAHKSGPEDMVSFWDPIKHTLVDSVSGQFQSGRPWSALFFEDNICFLNVHAGHYNFIDLTRHLLKVVMLLEKHVEKSKKVKPDFRIIMAGDFNNIINKDYTRIVLSSKKFYLNPTRFTTFSRMSPRRKIHFDHIIDTKATPTQIYLPITAKLTSDHLPVIALLEA
uniref:Endonuclease/exonuclease/phosphatase domain-containing protein n=1 Tax=viral metagenome TaxID=1070528 RepID=A0A6C0CAT3_9ZZZZ